MTQFPVLIPDPITSAANAEVKTLRALHKRKYRKKSGWFLAEGARICHEAVALGWDMHRLAFLAGRETDAAIRPLLDGLAASGGRALPMTERLLQRIRTQKNEQVHVRPTRNSIRFLLGLLGKSSNAELVHRDV